MTYPLDIGGSIDAQRIANVDNKVVVQFNEHLAMLEPRKDKFHIVMLHKDEEQFFKSLIMH